MTERSVGKKWEFVHIAQCGGICDKMETRTPTGESIYRICPYRSRAQIEAWARIEAGGQEDKSLIEAGSRIVAGSRTGVRR